MASGILASVSVVLGAEIGDFKAKMAAARAEIRGLLAAGKQLQDIGKPLSVLSVAIAGLGAISGKAAVDFESAFAGVKKTLDTLGLSAQQTQAEYERLAGGIRQMAKEIPAAATEIAGVAEAAGQLGIKRENVLEFTRVMVDLGNSTNLSADQAATSLARLANITQLPQDQFSNLGSAIVALGNNFATTESEITEIGRRLAAAGSQIGLTTAQTLGFGAALSSLGVEAEAGGTALSTVFKRIQVAVEKGGADLTKFAKVAGLSAKEFAARFKTDAAGAVLSFTEGLGRIKDAGGSTIQTLQALDLNDIRVSDSLLRLAGSGDLARRAVELGSVAFSENTALAKEAGQRYETTASQVQLAKNRLNDLGITVGNALLPALKAMSATVGAVTNALSSMSPGAASATVAIAAVVAAIGPLALVIGKIIALLPTLTVGLEALGAAVTVATGPIGLAVAAVAALAGGLYYLSQSSERTLQAYKDQKAATDTLTGSIAPLLDRYDALKAKTSLSVAEQEELKRIIQQVTAAVPSARAEIDAYGNTIALNTKKTREFIAVQQGLDVTNARKAIADQTEELEKRRRTLAFLQREQRRFNETGKIFLTSGPRAAFTDDIGEIQKFQEQLVNATKAFDEQNTTVTNLKRTLGDYSSAGVGIGKLINPQLGSLTAGFADLRAATLGTVDANNQAAVAAAKHAATLGELKEQLKAARERLDTQVGGTKEFATTKAEITRLEELIRKLEDTGKTARKSADQVAEAFARIRKALAGVDTKVSLGEIAPGAEAAAAKIDVLEKGLSKLASLGVSSANKGIKALAVQLATLRQSLDAGFEPIEGPEIKGFKIPRTIKDTLDADVQAILKDYKGTSLEIPVTLAPVMATGNNAGQKILNTNIAIAKSFERINAIALTAGKNIASGFSPAAERINTLQGAIADLIDNGFNALDPAVQALVDQLNAAFKELKLETLVRDMNAVISSGLAEVAANMTAGIANILAGAAPISSLGGILLGTIGDVLVNLGKLAIAAAITVEAIKKAFANPATALAAGVAAIALGTLLKGSANKILSGGGGSVRPSFTPSSPTANSPKYANGPAASINAPKTEQTIRVEVFANGQNLEGARLVYLDRQGRILGKP